MAQTDEWLSRKEASRYLERNGCPISPERLAKMACNSNSGDGPRFFKSGWRTIRYRRDDLDTWRERVMVQVG